MEILILKSPWSFLLGKNRYDLRIDDVIREFPGGFPNILALQIVEKLQLKHPYGQYKVERACFSLHFGINNLYICLVLAKLGDLKPRTC